MNYRLLIAPPSPCKVDEELRVLEWHRQPGEACQKGDLLLELETSKAVLELRPQRTVILRKALAADGEWFKLGSVLAVLSDLPDEPLPEDQAGLEDLPLDVDEL